MTMLLKVWHEGKLVGQCDAKCYEAESTECRCVCLGDHHGIGRNLAVEKLRTKKLGWLATYPEKFGFKVEMF